MPAPLTFTEPPSYTSEPSPPYLSHQADGASRRRSSTRPASTPSPSQQGSGGAESPVSGGQRSPVGGQNGTRPRAGERKPSSTYWPQQTGAVGQPDGRPLNHYQNPAQATEHDSALEQAMKESREAAELEAARVASARAEEERLLRITIAQSSSHDRMRAQRISREQRLEEEAVQESLRLERERKGKQRARETSQERREKEEMDMAIAISLSQPGPPSEATRRFQQLLSQPSINRSARESSPADSSSSSNPSRQRTLPPPPAYERADEEAIAANPRNFVLGPEPSGSRHAMSQAHLPETPTSAVRYAAPPRQGSTSQMVSSPPASAFYSPQIAAAMPPPVPSRPPSSIPTNSSSPPLSPTFSSPGLDNSGPADDSQNPFDESVAAVHVSWGSSDEEDEDEDEDGLPGQGRSGPDDSTSLRPRDLFQTLHLQHKSDSHIPQARRPHDGAPRSQSSLDLPTRSISPTLRSSPLFGGTDANTGVNAVADDALVHGVRFGFLPMSEEDKRAPLAHCGPFPDVAQLSRVGGPDGQSQEFASFAVEASGWGPLLIFMMWHGNSHFEASPRDLQQEKSEAGLSCAISVEFFRNEAQELRVRCRLDLLPSMSPYRPPLGEADFSIEHPSITIHIPGPPLLPILLSTVATTLSSAHTASRSKATLTRSELSSRALRGLAPAVDLFKRLNGEPLVDDAEEMEHEETLMTRLTGRLKRRKKGVRLVKGGADGTGTGQPLQNTGPLPEGALLMTPFML